jgi:HSP20 family molecular chaperone IbpA
MSTLTHRRGNPLAEMLGWLDSETGAGVLGLGLNTPYVRIEDYVDDDTYVLRAEMPGIDPDKDVEIGVAGDVLTISGERREEHQDRMRHEFHYGSFSRSVRLPRLAKSEDVTASYRDGVLELRVPLDGAGPEARLIPIQRAED